MLHSRHKKQQHEAGCNDVFGGAGAEPLAILRHDSEVSGAAFTADETKVLSWSIDKTARLWDLKKPERPLLTFRHDGRVTGAVFNADETKLLTSGDDNTARLWNAKTGKLIHKLVYEPLDQLDAWMKTTITEAPALHVEPWRRELRSLRRISFTLV